MLTLPSLPERMNSAASMMCLQLRHCEPICTTRWWRLAASSMARPSSMVVASGFSTYTSLPAWQASTVGNACQWSGVAMSTTSTSLRSSTRRKSFTVSGFLPRLLLANLDAFGDHRVVHVADHGAIDLGVQEEAFEVALAHAAAADEPKADLVVRAGFAGAKRSNKRAETAQDEGGGPSRQGRLTQEFAT